MLYYIKFVCLLSSRAGIVPYKTALDMSLYLDKEEDYVPWKTATSALAYIGSRLSMTPNYGLYQVNIGSCVFSGLV